MSAEGAWPTAAASGIFEGGAAVGSPGASPVRRRHTRRKDSNLRRDARQGAYICCLLYTSPSPRDLSTSRMPSSA